MNHHKAVTKHHLQPCLPEEKKYIVLKRVRRAFQQGLEAAGRAVRAALLPLQACWRWASVAELGKALKPGQG